MNKELLQKLCESGKSMRQISVETGFSMTNIRYWIHKHGLKTRLMTATGLGKAKAIMRLCFVHGEVLHSLMSSGRYKCRTCSTLAVDKRRKKIKLMAIEYKGGSCNRCGYCRCVAALEFHHLDPSEKDFSFSGSDRILGWDKLKPELNKCLLLCANCHREIHAGFCPKA